MKSSVWERRKMRGLLFLGVLVCLCALSIGCPRSEEKGGRSNGDAHNDKPNVKKDADQPEPVEDNANAKALERLSGCRSKREEAWKTLAHSINVPTTVDWDVCIVGDVVHAVYSVDDPKGGRSLRYARIEGSAKPVVKAVAIPDYFAPVERVAVAFGGDVGYIVFGVNGFVHYTKSANGGKTWERPRKLFRTLPEGTESIPPTVSIRATAASDELHVAALASGTMLVYSFPEDRNPPPNLPVRQLKYCRVADGKITTKTLLGNNWTENFPVHPGARPGQQLLEMWHDGGLHIAARTTVYEPSDEAEGTVATRLWSSADSGKTWKRRTLKEETIKRPTRQFDGEKAGEKVLKYLENNQATSEMLWKSLSGSLGIPKAAEWGLCDTGRVVHAVHLTPKGSIRYVRLEGSGKPSAITVALPDDVATVQQIAVAFEGNVGYIVFSSKDVLYSMKSVNGGKEWGSPEKVTFEVPKAYRERRCSITNVRAILAANALHIIVDTFAREGRPAIPWDSAWEDVTCVEHLRVAGGQITQKNLRTTTKYGSSSRRKFPPPHKRLPQPPDRRFPG